MTKTTKKKKLTASPTSPTKKSKSTSSKKSNDGSSKKSHQKGKSTNAPKGKSTDACPAARTPDRKQRKSPSLQLTPLTVTLPMDHPIVMLIGMIKALIAHVLLHSVIHLCLAIRTVHTMLHMKIMMNPTTAKTCTMKNPITMLLAI